MTRSQPVASDSPIAPSTPPTSTQPTSNRIDALLVLRAFACLMVVIIHSGPPAKVIFYRGIDLSWISFSHGYVAVWIFFCLSGYLMGKAFYTERYLLNPQGVFNFWRNRAFRIFPLYYFAVFILTIFVYPEMLKLENWGHLVRICTFTYVGWLIPSPPKFNFALWSLSTEVQFYLLVPFIYAALRALGRSRRRVFLVMGGVMVAVFGLKLLIWIALRRQIVESVYFAYRYWYMPLATNFDVFLMGFLLNPLLRSRRSQPCAAASGDGTVAQGGSVMNDGDSTVKRVSPRSFLTLKALNFQWIHFKWFAVGLILGLYLLTAHHFYHQELLGTVPRPIEGFRTATTIFIFQPLTAVITAIFIIAFESNPAGGVVPQNQPLSFQAMLDNPLRLLEIFGILSYGIYIWHGPIIHKISTIFTSTVPVEGFYLRCMAVLFLSTAMSALTYYLVEIPAARWKLYRRSSS